MRTWDRVRLLLLAGALATPAIAAEPMFDSHAHLVTEDAAHYPRLPPEPPSPTKTPGVAGAPGGHSGPNPLIVVPEAERLLGWMRADGVQGMAAVQRRSIYGFDNSYVLDMVAAHPREMTAIIGVSPSDPKAPALVERLARGGRIVGFRLAGRATDKPWVDALALWAVAERHGLVVDVDMLGEGRPLIATLARLARAHPHARLVLDHVLHLDLTRPLDPAAKALAGIPNVYFKFTTISLDETREAGGDAAEALRRAVDLYGAEHVMWGSDVGTSAGTYHEMVERARAATARLSPEERRQVLYETGRKLFARGD